MNDSDAVDTVALFTTSTARSSRRIAFQFLAVFTHLQTPTTHRRVLLAMTRLQKHSSDIGCFEKQINLISKDFEKTKVDDR